MTGGGFLVYRSPSLDVRAASPPPGISVELWRPGLGRVWPPPAREPVLAAFWAFHMCGAFPHADYSAIVVFVDGAVAHRSMVYPAYFAFPFMGRDDVQVGNTMTLPEYRGRGLASLALGSVPHLLGRAGRALWYVTHRENQPSRRVAERAGLSLFATATRYSRWGLRQLGAFALDRTG